MTIHEAIVARHSVRQYHDTPISGEHVQFLNERIASYNAEGNLHIQLVTEERKALAGIMARMLVGFNGAKNYFALIGPDSPDLDERLGYYGERLVLEAQMLGLNTCWVGGTFSKVKSACSISAGETFHAVIALGYGRTQGKQHVSKPVEKLADGLEGAPEWYRKGVEYALLAPTATNCQAFHFSREGNKVTLAYKKRPFSEMDRGIVKLHFEIGAGDADYELTMA